MTIGERICYLRECEGISQAALARELKATRAAVNAWELGISNPNMKSLIDISSFFHVSLDYLLGLEDNERLSISSLSIEEKKIVRRLVRYLNSLHELDEEKNEPKLSRSKEK